MRLVLAFVAVSILTLNHAWGQSFSCSIGSQPACLDYGDKVCSSMAKCVSSGAICFDSYTCDFRGFVCKSTLDEAVEEIEAKVDQHNLLVQEFNELREEAERLSTLLVGLRREHQTLVSDVEDYARCVEWANTLEEAQNCSRP